MTLRKSSIKVILVPLLVPLLKTVAKNPLGLRTKIDAFRRIETPLSQIWKSRDFRTFFGATFGATLYVILCASVLHYANVVARIYV